MSDVQGTISRIYSYKYIYGRFNCDISLLDSMGLRDLVLGVGVRAIRVCSYLVSIIMIFIVLSLQCSPQEDTTSLPSMLTMHLRLCHDCIDSILRDVLHRNCRGFGELSAYFVLPIVIPDILQLF